MPGVPKVQIRIGADDAEARRVLGQFGDWLKAGFGINLAGRITEGLAEIPRRIEGFLREGFRFNDVLESSQIRLASLLRQFDPGHFTTFNSAMQRAGGLLKDLQVNASDANETFGGLLRTYTQLSGAMFSAHIPLGQQVPLAGLFTRAIAGLGRGSGDEEGGNYRIMNEARMLLMGNATPGSRLSAALLPTERDRQQYQAAMASGRAAAFLTARLQAFQEAGQASSQTLEALSNRLRNTMNEVGGEAMQPAYDAAKKILKELNDTFSSEGFQTGAKEMGKAAAKLIEMGGKGLNFGAGHLDWLTDLAALAALFAAPRAGKLAGNAVKYLGSAWGGLNLARTAGSAYGASSVELSTLYAGGSLAALSSMILAIIGTAISGFLGGNAINRAYFKHRTGYDWDTTELAPGKKAGIAWKRINAGLEADDAAAIKAEQDAFWGPSTRYTQLSPEARAEVDKIREANKDKLESLKPAFRQIGDLQDLLSPLHAMMAATKDTDLLTYTRLSAKEISMRSRISSLSTADQGAMRLPDMGTSESHAGFYSTRGQMILAQEGIELQRSMVDELRGIRGTLESRLDSAP